MMSKDAKIFLIKGTILFAVVLIVQALLSNYFPEQIDFPSQIDSLDDGLNKNTDIFLFGDSVINWYDKKDTCKDSIASMISKKLDSYTLTAITHPSYHMDVYAAYAHYIATQSKRPKLVIISINMRSFSPSWDLNPGMQFESIVRMLTYGNIFLVRMVYRPLQVFKLNLFKQDNEITEHDFANTPVYNGPVKVGLVKDFIGARFAKYSEENMRKKIIFYYMNTITVRHRKFQSMLDIVNAFKLKDIPVLFYITPVDYQTGEKYFPGTFKKHVEKNARGITRAFISRNIPILDLSLALGTDHFTWDMYPNEHLNEKGRMFVADQLVNTIQATLEQKPGHPE